MNIESLGYLTFVQIRLIEVVRTRNIHIVKTRDIPMPSEMLQQLYLTQGTFGQNLLAEDIGNFLDSDALASLVVGRSTDNTICSLAQLFGDGVSLVNDEILIEDFEDLAALQRRVTHADAPQLNVGGVVKSDF